MNQTIIVICSVPTDASRIEDILPPSEVIHFNGNETTEQLCDRLRPLKFKSAIIHLPNEGRKAIDLQKFLRAVQCHARVRILPVDYATKDLLEPAWRRVTHSALHKKAILGKKVVA